MLRSGYAGRATWCYNPHPELFSGHGKYNVRFAPALQAWGLPNSSGCLTNHSIELGRTSGASSVVAADLRRSAGAEFSTLVEPH